MAITTLNGVIAGLTPPMNLFKAGPGTAAVYTRTAWYSAGYPSAAVANTSGLAGVALTTDVGAFPFQNPVSGNTYLSNWQNGVLYPNVTTYAPWWLVDRLWHNSGLDHTLITAQTVNSAAWPARDINQSTNGEGVYIAIEVSTLMGTGTPACTMTYTNSAGTTGRVATQLIQTPAVASTAVGAWYVFALAPGDTGVRSIQDITFSVSWGAAGVLHLVAFRPIAMITSENWNGTPEDAVTLAMPRLFDNSVLQVIYLTPNASLRYGLQATVGYTQG